VGLAVTFRELSGLEVRVRAVKEDNHLIKKAPEIQLAITT
jgi:hypothetical protein